MKKFTELLYEAENIITTEKFVKNVEDYVFKNDQKYAKNLAKQKKKIPAMFRTPKTLYRGMVLNDDQIQQIKDGTPLILDKISSWTKDKNIAKKFITDKSKIVKSKGGNGIIFKKNINTNDIILDIHSYVLFLKGMGILKKYDFDEITEESAVEEQEVLIDKGIKLISKDIDTII